MSAEGKAVIDTNVLVYATDSSAPQHEIAKTLYDAEPGPRLA
jgi:predicted nucleic acid-binding protein